MFVDSLVSEAGAKGLVVPLTALVSDSRPNRDRNTQVFRLVADDATDATAISRDSSLVNSVYSA